MINRRELLASSLAAGLLPATFGLAQSTSRPARGLRIAFLTDAHLRAPSDDRDRGNERVVKAFDLTREQNPDLVIFGGDNVFAVDYGNTVLSAVSQFENWRRMIARHVTAPHISVIGNHDIWTGEHAEQNDLGGKKYALEVFGMPNRYFAHDQGGWRFLMLDTFHTDGCYIDDEQIAWMTEQIDSSPGPVALVSHASIINICFYLETKEPGRHPGFNSPSGWVIGNAQDIIRLLARRPKVRLALSGHMHQVEEVDYLGMKYICGGAVSGAWWGGTYLEFFPANVMFLDLGKDGSVRMTNVNYES